VQKRANSQQPHPLYSTIYWFLSLPYFGKEIILSYQDEVGDDVTINSICPVTRNSFRGLSTLWLSNVLDGTLQLEVWTGL
jgi:hypothetical protein